MASADAVLGISAFLLLETGRFGRSGDEYWKDESTYPPPFHSYDGPTKLLTHVYAPQVLLRECIDRVENILASAQKSPCSSGKCLATDSRYRRPAEG